MKGAEVFTNDGGSEGETEVGFHLPLERRRDRTCAPGAPSSHLNTQLVREISNEGGVGGSDGASRDGSHLGSPFIIVTINIIK